MSKDTRLTRRQSLALIVTTASAGLIPLSGRTADDLDPADPNAVALGFTRNHTTVNHQRWPKKAGENPRAPQRCGSCAMRSDDGACRLFRGQQVPADGWCNAWTRT